MLTSLNKVDTLYLIGKEITFWNFEKNKKKVGFADKGTYNEYRLIIKEKFKNKKLIKISIKYKYNGKGKEYFEKYVNTTNFLKFISDDLKCVAIKKK